MHLFPPLLLVCPFNPSEVMQLSPLVLLVHLSSSPLPPLLLVPCSPLLLVRPSPPCSPLSSLFTSPPFSFFPPLLLVRPLNPSEVMHLWQSKEFPIAVATMRETMWYLSHQILMDLCRNKFGAFFVEVIQHFLGQDPERKNAHISTLRRAYEIKDRDYW